MKYNRIFYIFLTSILISSILSFDTQLSSAVDQSDGDLTNPITIPEPLTYNWSEPSLVSAETLNETYHPSQAVDSIGNVHVVWVDETSILNSDNDSDIFYKYLDVNTGIWSSAELISTNSTYDSFTPEIVIDQNDVICVVWTDATPYLRTDEDLDIFVAYKEGILGSWSEMMQVSTQSTEDSLNPSVAVDSFGSIYVVWADSTDYLGCGSDLDIFFKVGSINSEFWLMTEVISTESNGDSIDPFIAVDSLRDAHVVWADHTDFGVSDEDVSWKIVHKFRSISTLIWSSLKVLTTSFDSDIYVSEVGSYTVINRKPILRIDYNDTVHLAHYVEELYSYVHGIVPPSIRNTLSYTKIESSWLKQDPEVSPSSTDIIRTYFYQFNHPTLLNHKVGVNFDRINSRPAFAIDSQFNVHLAFPAKLYFFNMIVVFYDCVFYMQLNSANHNLVFTLNSTVSSSPTLTTDLRGRINLIWQDYLYHNDTNTHLDIFHSSCIVAPLAPIILDITQQNGKVSLDWEGYGYVDSYYIYRDIKLITYFSLEQLSAITHTLQNNYIDSLVAEDRYYYVIMGSNILANGTISSCHSIEVTLGFINNFNIDFWTFTSVVGSLSIISAVSVVLNFRLRRK
jgi:hypothetical protein